MIPFLRHVKPSVSLSPNWLILWGNLGDKPENCTYFKQGSFEICNTQPALSPRKRFIVVGEAWLTNRIELLHHLETSKNADLKTDLELVAALWEVFGKECMSQLQGNFVVGVWDSEEERLWLGRDRVGAKTLYYTTTGSIRVCAPRLKTLSPWHSLDLDLVALRDYLACAFVPGNRTLWEQVRELRPGTILSFPNEKIHSYWQPKEETSHPDKTLLWHGQKLQNLLHDIILEYLPQNQPVGVYLSGGLDSSCITALAAKYHNFPVHTYSIHFGAECPHELEFSDLVASHCHTQHSILEITPSQMWDLLPLVMANLDDPIGDPLTVPNYLLAQFAREQTQVILNGEGGDPCFGGPKNQPMLLTQLYGNTKLPDLVTNYLTSFKKCATDLSQLLQPDIYKKVISEPSIFAEDLYTDAQYINRLMVLNIKYKGADHILTKVNNLTQSAGLQGRSPLFDSRVVQLAMQTPPEYKLAGAEEKAVLKQAVADLLPEAIIKRPKSGMRVPVQLWFHRYWQRKTKQLLLSRNSEIAPYLNQQLIRDWTNYQGDTWKRYGVKLWLLVSLELWLRNYR